MDKYKAKAQERLANDQGHGRHKVHSEKLAQTALAEGAFATKEREDFYTSANGDIMVDYFMEWLQTEPHETKTREFLWSCCMGLGDVKARLIQKEMLAKNMPHLIGGNK